MMSSLIIEPIFAATFPFYSEYMTRQQFFISDLIGYKSDHIFSKIEVRPVCKFIASEKSWALNQTQVPNSVEMMNYEASALPLS